jgi:outer membrane protein OmpA-like peptidoglycan-associated protein
VRGSLRAPRGRTDGCQDSPADSRIAKDRAEAVKDRLVGAGIDPARIRTTYQPSGDHAADNTTKPDAATSHIWSSPSGVALRSTLGLRAKRAQSWGVVVMVDEHSRVRPHRSHER